MENMTKAKFYFLFTALALTCCCRAEQVQPATKPAPLRVLVVASDDERATEVVSLLGKHNMEAIFASEEKAASIADKFDVVIVMDIVSTRFTKPVLAYGHDGAYYLDQLQLKNSGRFT